MNTCDIKTLHPQKNACFWVREKYKKLLYLGNKDNKCKSLASVFKEEIKVSPGKAQMD